MIRAAKYIIGVNSSLMLNKDCSVFATR